MEGGQVQVVTNERTTRTPCGFFPAPAVRYRSSFFFFFLLGWWHFLVHIFFIIFRLAPDSTDPRESRGITIVSTLDSGLDAFFFFLTSSVSAVVDISKMLLYILACVWLSWFPGVGHFAPSKWQQIHKCWQKGIERTLVTRRVYYTPLLRCHFAWLREDAPFKLQTTWKRKRNKKEKRQKKKDGTTSTDYISQDFLSR